MDRYLPGLLGLAFVWGLSEASFFFVIPDVIVSYIALRYGLKSGILAAITAIIGAVIGGALTYFWGLSDIEGARAYFDSLPAISSATIARAGAEIVSDQPLFLLVKGAFTSVPYKLYASEAGATGLSLQKLMLMTPAVRAPRFLIAAGVAALAHHFAPSTLKPHRVKLLVAFWVVFYALYWSFAPDLTALNLA